MGHGYGTPITELIVEARSLLSHDSSSSVETYEVHKPSGLGRQRDQLVRATLKQHPEAQLASAEDGIATFYSHTQMIVAYYADAGRAGIDDQFQRTRASAGIPF